MLRASLVVVARSPSIIKIIISLFLSFSNTERREIVFCTQWFIGQYCSKRGERVPLSLYISRKRRERTFVAVLHFHFMTLHSTDAKVNFSGQRTRFRSNVEPLETRYRRLRKWARTTIACRLERDREGEGERELLWCAKRLCLTGHVEQRWIPHQIFFLFLLDQRAQRSLVPSSYWSSLAHATGDGYAHAQMRMRKSSPAHGGESVRES